MRVCAEHLRRYNEGLQLSNVIRMCDALEVLGAFQEEEMRRLQQELERTRRQLVQQAKKLKEYGSLLTEVKELRDFNRRLQDVLLMRLGSGERRDTRTCLRTHTHAHQNFLSISGTKVEGYDIFNLSPNSE